MRGFTVLKNQCRKSFPTGFTLIELLVVIAIIGLLATIIIVNVSGVQANSRDARRTEDIDSLRKALTLYANDFQGYPASPQEGPAGNLAAVLVPNYLSAVPPDPRNDGGCNPITAYAYCYQSDGKTYNLRYCLETNSVAGYATGCHALTP